MELSPKMSKTLRVSLLVLVAILLLLIGSAFGSHFSHGRNFSHNNNGCSGQDRFEGGNRFEGRNSGRRFRMMIPGQAGQDSQVEVNQINPAKKLISSSTQAVSSTPSATPTIK